MFQRQELRAGWLHSPVYMSTDVGNYAASSAFALYAPPQYTITPNGATVWEQTNLPKFNGKPGSPTFLAGAVKLLLCRTGSNPQELGYFPGTLQMMARARYGWNHQWAHCRRRLFRIADEDTGSVVAKHQNLASLILRPAHQSQSLCQHPQPSARQAQALRDCMEHCWCSRVQLQLSTKEGVKLSD